MRNWLWNATVMLAVIALAGCGDSGPEIPELVAATGTVTQKGKPLEGATVSFWPSGKGSPAVGGTDAEGRFELSYAGRHPGAPIGTHTVRISKMSGEAGDELVPGKYNDNSKLTKEVTKDGPNDFKFEL